MRILWINTHLLHPLDRGGTIRSYHMLRCLMARHEITYVAPSQDVGGEASRLASAYCHHLVEVSSPPVPTRGSWRFRRQALANLASTLPLKLALYDAPALRRALRQLTVRRTFDVAVVDFLFSALPSRAVAGVPRILFQHNVEALIMQRMAEHAGGLARRYFAAQAARMRRSERTLSREVDQVVAVSNEDANLMREWYGIERPGIVATGVDTAFHHPRRAPAGSNDVVFVGSLDWLPNLDGIEWFLEEVWPRVVAMHPAARLHLVGRRPPEALRSRCRMRADVALWPDVPDVREHLWPAAVAVVPLRIGGGTRLKIFEAFACGKAVVSTRIGAEGLPIEDGKHLVLADTADGFADQVVALLRDEACRTRLGSEARELVARQYSWEAVTRAFEDICERVASSGGPVGTHVIGDRQAKATDQPVSSGV